MADITVVQADYHDEQHARDLMALMENYAADPMGGGAPLSDDCKEHLVAELAQLPHALSLLTYCDGEPAGLANCFLGFSTFACRPLLNLHDFVVAPKFRGQGISQSLLAAVARQAQLHNCCKVTLEVLAQNEVAQHCYRKAGFAPYKLDKATGAAQFWQKLL